VSESSRGWVEGMVYAVVSSFKINRFKWIYAVWGCMRAEKLFA